MKLKEIKPRGRPYHHPLGKIRHREAFWETKRNDHTWWQIDYDWIAMNTELSDESMWKRVEKIGNFNVANFHQIVEIWISTFIST